MRTEASKNQVQTGSNVHEGVDGEFGEGPHGVAGEVFAGGGERLRNLLQARTQRGNRRRVERRRLQESLEERAERLEDIEPRIALPAAQDVQLPVHTRQRGADQAVVDLL